MEDFTQPPVRRVFLGLWPDEVTRDALYALARQLDGPGRRVPREHLHLTLAFAGTVPAEQADCLRVRIHELRSDPIPLTLDRLGHFARPRVTWLGPADPPPALGTLAEQALGLCRECGIQADERPFHPHVTLRRHARPPATDTPPVPIHWQAATVVLIESGQEGRPGPYRILAQTPTG